MSSSYLSFHPTAGCTSFNSVELSASCATLNATGSNPPGLESNRSSSGYANGPSAFASPQSGLGSSGGGGNGSDMLVKQAMGDQYFRYPSNTQLGSSNGIEDLSYGANIAQYQNMYMPMCAQGSSQYNTFPHGYPPYGGTYVPGYPAGYSYLNPSYNGSWCGRQIPGDGKKRGRQTYSRYQTLELEKEFHCNRYITRKRRIELMMTIHLSERQIKIWFQNRRMKEKKEKKLTQEVKGQSSAAPHQNPTTTPGTATTPTKFKKEAVVVGPCYQAKL